MSRTFLASLTSLSFAVSFASLFPTDSVSFAETQKDAANTSVSPKKEDEKPEITTYPDVSSALSAVLERAEKDAGKKPRLVAFGEYHQLKGKTHIRSALKRFTDDLFPLVKSLASDLVLETFIPEGNCGKQEKQVVKDVETTTKRPETTESELVTLIKQAKAQGVKVKKGLFPWAASGRAIANGRDEGFTKLLFDDSPEAHGHGKILGGGMVGTHAGDMIGEIALAIEMGADAVDIGKTIHPHPTLGESIGMAAEVAHGSCTDVPPARK
jgi:hypothetical protein